MISEIAGAISSFFNWLTGERDPDKQRLRRLRQIDKKISKLKQEKQDYVQKQLSTGNQEKKAKYALLAYHLDLELIELRVEKDKLSR